MIKRIFIVLYVLAGLFCAATLTNGFAHRPTFEIEWLVVGSIPAVIVFAIHYIIGLRR